MAQTKRYVRSAHSEQPGDAHRPDLLVATSNAQGDCGCMHDDLPRMSECGLDPIDVLIIRLIRRVCAGYASGQTAHWDAACDLAEQDLGSIDGPSFVARTISLMRAVQRERNGGFGFMSPWCSHISEHELQIIALIRAARQQHTNVFKSALSDLASIPNPARIAIAASALAGLCVRHAALCNSDVAAPDQRTLN